MLFKGKLLVSIASIGVVGGTGAGIYYSKIKNESTEKDNVAGDKGSHVAAPTDVQGSANPDSAADPVPVVVPKVEPQVLPNNEVVVDLERQADGSQKGSNDAAEEVITETQDQKEIESIEWTALVPANQINS